MCDEITEADNATHLTRRQLGASAGAVGMAALLPTSADAKPVKGRDVTITTPDGQCDAYFTAPASGKHPGVLMWPDIMGLRPAFRQMADRLAGEGYAVLVVNQFYRSTKSPIVQPGESFD
jgi:carboxymethylenebutenolidase